MIILMNKSQDITVAPETDFHYETKARKVMAEFKFDALYMQVSLHREHPEVG